MVTRAKSGIECKLDEAITWSRALSSEEKSSINYVAKSKASLSCKICALPDSFFKDEKTKEMLWKCIATLERFHNEH